MSDPSSDKIRDLQMYCPIDEKGINPRRQSSMSAVELREYTSRPQIKGLESKPWMKAGLFHAMLLNLTKPFILS